MIESNGGGREGDILCCDVRIGLHESLRPIIGFYRIFRIHVMIFLRPDARGECVFRTLTRVFLLIGISGCSSRGYKNYLEFYQKYVADRGSFICLISVNLVPISLS